MRAIIVDTGAWLLAAKGVDPYLSALDSADEVIVPGLVLAEVDYHLRRQRRDFHRVLDDISRGAYAYEVATLEDLERAQAIDKKFREVDLGLVDASIAALAERLGIYDLLTTDSDFVPVRVGQRWDRALRLVVAPRTRER